VNIDLRSNARRIWSKHDFCAHTNGNNTTWGDIQKWLDARILLTVAHKITEAIAVFSPRSTSSRLCRLLNVPTSFLSLVRARTESTSFTQLVDSSLGMDSFHGNYDFKPLTKWRVLSLRLPCLRVLRTFFKVGLGTHIRQIMILIRSRHDD
jgi:hypothetical protein